MQAATSGTLRVLSSINIIPLTIKALSYKVKTYKFTSVSLNWHRCNFLRSLPSRYRLMDFCSTTNYDKILLLRNYITACIAPIYQLAHSWQAKTIEP